MYLVMPGIRQEMSKFWGYWTDNLCWINDHRRTRNTRQDGVYCLS